MNETPMEAAATWLVRLREDTLSEADMAQWIAWCEAHPENLRTFEDLQALWRTAGENPPAPEQIAHLLRSDVPAHFHASSRRGRWALAASLALLAMGGFWALRYLPLTSAPAAVPRASLQKIAASDVVQTPVAQNREGLLPDGSRVDLGARTVLDVDFSTTRRQLELREGQAFFHVTRDKSRPFVVAVGTVEVVAIGTAFDVRRAPSEIAVTVQEGSVKMVKTRGDAVSATAGYQLVFDTASGKIRKSLVDPNMATAWRSGRLEFTGDPLDVVISNVNRYASRPIVLSDPELRELTFTGTVFTASIDASLEAMEQVFPIEVQRSASQIKLVHRR